MQRWISKIQKTNIILWCFNANLTLGVLWSGNNVGDGKIQDSEVLQRGIRDGQFCYWKTNCFEGFRYVVVMYTQKL